MCIPLNVEDQEKSIHSQSAFCTQSAVCILYLVCISYPVCSLQSAFCTDRICIVFFLFERASSPDRNIGARKIISVRLSWPLWLMCGLYVEELPRTSTIMEQWLLYTNWRRTLPRLNNMAASDTLLRDHSVLKWARYGSPRCGHFGFSVQVAFLEIRNCNLWLLSLSNPANILFFSAWISELHRN